MIHSASQYLEATKASGVVVVRCTAEWCGPCRTIAKPYSELKMNGVKFYTIDVEKVEDFADAGAATKIPCFFIFKDGKRVGMVVGANLDNLTSCIGNIL